MADILIHLTTAEHLAHDPRITGEIGKIMSRDLATAKLGAVFADLPYFNGVYRSLFRYLTGRTPGLQPWAQVFHTHKPTTLGLAFAELSQTDAEYAGQSWPVAFVMGYFSHLALDRVLHGLSQRLVHDMMHEGDTFATAHARCQQFQSLLFHREYYGHDILGTKAVKSLMKFSDDGSSVIDEKILRFMMKGCLKALGRSPREKEFRRWCKAIQGLGNILSLSLVRSFNIEKGAEGQRLMHTYYRNDFFDYFAYYNYAVDLSVEYLNGVHSYMNVGDYTEEARYDLRDIVPEMDVYAPPDDEFSFTVSEAHASPAPLPSETESKEDETIENVLPFTDPQKS